MGNDVIERGFKGNLLNGGENAESASMEHGKSEAVMVDSIEQMRV